MKKYWHFIILIYIISIVPSCMPYIKVKNYDQLTKVTDIKDKKELTHALQTNYIEFFDGMIKQRHSKTPGNNWEIFCEDSTKIYWGYSLLTRNGIYIDTLFYTEKSEIETEFPDYNPSSGYFYLLRRKLDDYIYDNYDFGEECTFKHINESFRMTPEGIRIEADFEYKYKPKNSIFKKKNQVSFLILVNRMTLELSNRKILD